MISYTWDKLFKNRFQIWLDGWLKRRNPPQKTHVLKHNNIFIVPSKTGLYFCVLIFLLWLLGTNYENNLILSIAFLLLALMIVCIHHTYAHLAGLSISIVKTHAGFAGDTGIIDLIIKRINTRSYEAIELSSIVDESVRFSLLDDDHVKVSLRVPLLHRGWCQPGRVKITTRFPLGLIVAWSYLYIDSRILAYPQAVESSVMPTQQLLDENDEIVHQQFKSGSEEFAGIREYVAGDSLRDIDWRVMARGQGLATRMYEDHMSENYWLDWHQFEGLSKEARLSRLCFCVLDLAQNQQSSSTYGLRLPNHVIDPSIGEDHKLKLLEALALFEWERVDRV
jgi:uncharacterized protein (DUF58 family)